VREAASGCWAMRHFRRAAIAHCAVTKAQIANEDRRSKTLVATLPAYLNALTGGRGCTW